MLKEIIIEISRKFTKQQYIIIIHYYSTVLGGTEQILDTGLPRAAGQPAASLYYSLVRETSRSTTAPAACCLILINILLCKYTKYKLSVLVLDVIIDTNQQIVKCSYVPVAS